MSKDTTSAGAPALALEHTALELAPERVLDGLRGMVRARMVDDRLWLLSRQGKAHFVITSAGHEATQFGCAWAIGVGRDYVVPYYRDMALALALSEQLAGMSAGAASLESIVLDEGFGTLDAATLDTVAATLENLAARGDRMVGVVTHVPSLAERVPVRFEVRKDARSARVERAGL